VEKLIWFGLGAIAIVWLFLMYMNRVNSQPDVVCTQLVQKVDGGNLAEEPCQ
jgi:hypothetical protein